MLSRSERDKVFLEVQVQNLTQGPLWFEKIRLEPVDGAESKNAARRIEIPMHGQLTVLECGSAV